MITNKLKALEDLLSEDTFIGVDDEALIWTESAGWTRKKYCWVLPEDTKVLVLNAEVTEYIEDKVKKTFRSV